MCSFMYVLTHSYIFQFENLWLAVPVNEFGNLNYRDFLKMYSDSNPNVMDSSRTSKSCVPPSPRVLGRSHTSMSNRSLSRVSRYSWLHVDTFQTEILPSHCTVFNCENIYLNLEPFCFQTLHKIHEHGSSY